MFERTRTRRGSSNFWSGLPKNQGSGYILGYAKVRILQIFLSEDISRSSSVSEYVFLDGAVIDSSLVIMNARSSKSSIFT
jgi:hypothetical protein